METKTKMGMNRTGTALSPIDSKKMREGVGRYCVHERGGERGIAETRVRYLKEAESIGSIPIPTTLKGAVQAGFQKITGKRPEILIDKLGERLAFERSGTRLYDALIMKYEGLESRANLPSLEPLMRFRDEEARHFMIVADVLRELGADPTAMTPGADVSGVTATGVFQVVSDPRTTFEQCLEAVLVAELADHDGWEMLIQLCDAAGLDSASIRFRDALREEDTHLSEVRRWLQEIAMAEAGFEKRAGPGKGKKEGRVA